MRPQGIDRTELLRNISHAFRSPLGSILNITELLLLGIQGEIDEEAREAIILLKQDVQRLQHVTEAMFDLIQSDPLTLSLRDFDIVSVINEAVDQVRPNNAFPTQEIVVHGKEDLPLVHASPDAVRLVTISLVEYVTELTHGSAVGIWLKRTADEIIVSLGNSDLRLENDDLLAPVELYAEMIDELSIPLLLSTRLIKAQGGTLWASRTSSNALLINFSLPITAN
jgi:K+-sensing histidine kinase KdpD